MRRTNLFLITPPLNEAEAFVAQLEAALKATPIACVLVRFASKDPQQAKKILKTLAPLVQENDAALLLEGDAQLVGRTGADGVQVTGVGEALAGAIASMKPKHIVGVSGLRSKDDCMNAGEMDIDYLMFGAGDDEAATPNAARTLERVQWWAEIFNVPCVACAAALEDIAPLTQAGADFIAPGGWLWESADIAASLKHIDRLLRENAPQE